MNHMGFTKLFEFAAGLTPDSRRQEVESHLANCSRCQHEAASAQRLLETVRADRMVAPPEELVSRAVSIWKKKSLG